jgi:hypothetical protein
MRTADELAPRDFETPEAVPLEEALVPETRFRLHPWQLVDQRVWAALQESGVPLSQMCSRRLPGPGRPPFGRAR